MPDPQHNEPSPASHTGTIFGDLQNPRLIWAKGILFLVLGVLSTALLVARLPSLTEWALLCICIWSFCRAYYFAFYVIEHYVDPSYKFAGLSSLAKYLWKHRRSP
ncbi:hypothetical protein Mal15_12110 [Stieleria maiorica]|uniref:Uncharacterized protein n=1 Tax=Stieleria maiorica TaxID=2795974 RepID=A0A5B9M927_9BACT|nr:hypothetical protein [Stieleria maiorica]QEF97173.1 hypothetical protein Mal15_12110 [Stieleria maiorica]